MDSALLWKPIGTLIAPSLRLDVVGLVMLLLVLFIATVIARYSATYLQGEPPARLRRYWWAFGATISSVLGVVLANNLALLAVAWICTSLSLHVLLTHYTDRWQALVAAHKKFIASRIAETFLLAGVGLVGASTGTLEVDVLAAHARSAGLDAMGQWGMALVAVAALMKCAQLPVHGWLIQVMEAPTPVSALLHAGVINLSGFVLIRLAEPLAQAPAAQLLLVTIGALTAAVASLVATTRVSIKVALAWSTCAQMGFMLMECGLGLPGLALLHLVAHSLYKAHAFLASGEVVRASIARGSQPALRSVTWPRSIAAAAVALLLVTVAGALWQVHPAVEPGAWAIGGIVALALVPWLVPQAGPSTAARAGVAFALALLYFGLHAATARVVHAQPATAAGPVIALALFAALFLVHAALKAAPDSPWARRIQPWFFGGLFLDELFTRATFRLWPLRADHRAQEIHA